MIEWYRERARQERSMASNAGGSEARFAHAGLAKLLLTSCAAQDTLDRDVCRRCLLRSACRKAGLPSPFSRLAI